MKRLSASRALLIALPLTAAFALPAHADQGQDLYNANCTACHTDSSDFTRANRKVKDLPGLKARVRLCEQSLGLTWFDEDIDAVVTYLNVNYYKF